MSRKINCLGCNTHVGEVRDAALMKGLAHICPKCQKKVVEILKPKDTNSGSHDEYLKMMNQHKNKDNPFGDMFGDLFKSDAFNSGKR